MFKEFKDFAMRGNVVDLAVAVVIGAAFGKIVTSFVNDVLMPPIGMLVGMDFSEMALVLQEAVMDAEGNETAAAIAIKHGMFIQTVVDFLLVALAVFMVVKAINATKKKEEEAPAEPPAPPEDITLLREIRDALNK